MNLSLILSIAAALLLIVGFIGTFVPVLPGCPLAWGGLLAAYFSSYNHISILCLVITGIVAVVASVLDNFFPTIMTKKSGGSKAATRGATVGIIVGLFLGPLGIVIGPFVGAVLFEMLNHQHLQAALKSGFGSFVGLLAGTVVKLIACGLMTYYFIAALV